MQEGSLFYPHVAEPQARPSKWSPAEWVLALIICAILPSVFAYSLATGSEFRRGKGSRKPG